MNWNTKTLQNEQLVHTLVCELESDVQALRSQCLEVADYAFDLLDENVLDSSMFCIFDWLAEQNTLTIVITDSSKSKESKHVVVWQLNGAQAASIGETAEDCSEELKYWLRDHLTTSLTFGKFSLVAGFSEGDRQRLALM